jgi:hypothetical protein
MSRGSQASQGGLSVAQAASTWLKPGYRRQGCNPDPLMSALGLKRTFSEFARCPLYPRKGTSVKHLAMSALCQKRTQHRSKSRTGGQLSPKGQKEI